MTNVIASHAEARAALAALAGRPVGLDIETTGLDPLTCQVRLLQVAPLEGETAVIDLFKVGGLSSLQGEIQGLWPVCHNALFEMAFLRHAGVITTPDCTLLASHAVQGRAENLGTLSERHLGRSIEEKKKYQLSDWSGELSQQQIQYAAIDAEVTRDLWRHFGRAIEDHHLGFLYRLMVNAQPAVTAMHLAGMPFIPGQHETLCVRLQEQHDRLLTPLVKELGVNQPKVLKTKIKPGVPRNPNSTKQLNDWIQEHVPAPVLKRWPEPRRVRSRPVPTS